MKNRGQRLDNPERLSDLSQTGLLDVSGDEVFQRFVRLASQMLEAPVSLVSLVTDQEQQFVSSVGLPSPYNITCRTPLTHSFCQHVVITGEPLVVESSREDDLVKDSPAIEDLGVESYLGVPIVSEEGNILGSFCVIGDKPREWGKRDLEFMKDLCGSVSAEIELRRKSRRLQEANEELRMAQVRNDELIQLIVHDLRNPLSGIQGGVDLLKLKENPTEEDEEIVPIIEESCTAMMDLISEILETNKIETIGKEAVFNSFNIELLCQQLVRQVELLARSRSIKFTWKMENSPSEWVGESQLLRRMLHNLLINAIRYTPSGGRVALVVNSEDEGKKIRFSIIDDGPGVPKEERERIFRKFEVGKSASSRSIGLGLHFCKMTAEIHGGSISVEDGPDEKGSVFSVVLPLPKEETNGN